MNAIVPEQTFELVARQLGTHVSFVEKDWHVTQVLKALANIHNSQFKLIFSGGTALSKAHQLIQRFSEDIDFILVAQNKASNRKTRSVLKKEFISFLIDAGYPIEKNQVYAKNDNQFFAIHLNYETYFDRVSSLRPHIQIEVTVKSTQIKPVCLSVASLVSKLSQAQPEVKSISCIDIVESAAEKLSALTWRVPDRIRGSKNDDPSIVRHIYDLANLKDKITKDKQFKKILTNCINADANRIKNKPELIKLSIVERFEKLFGCLKNDPEYPAEYDKFVRAVCYSPENQIPDFEMAVDSIYSLIKNLFKTP